ncbi:MAG TPA: DinB family protein [Bacteroidota bacterium]
MTREEIAVLFDYDQWATKKLLDVIARIPEELYARNLGSSHGGLRGTLVHMIGAGDVWLKRWKGQGPTAQWNEGDFSTFSSIAEAWKSFAAAFDDYFKTVTDEQLSSPHPYRDMKGNPYKTVLWKQMHHLVNHGSYHRGQLVTMLRLSGVRPVGTDLIYYFREKEKNG